MGIIEFIIKEFTSYVAGKAFDKVGEKITRALSKKELERRFEAFCNDPRWHDVFESQGFAGGIDFTGLTEELKESIVDRAYDYYHSLDIRREDIQFEQYLEGLFEVAKADAAPQKKQVQEIVYAAYHIIGAFYVETLSPESQLAANISMRYTDVRIAELAAEIKALAEKGATTMALLESYAPPATGFLGRQADLAEIERRLKAGEGIVVICGQGGMGKSELAKEYSRLHRDDYDMICFAYYKGSVQSTVTDGLLWNRGDWNEMPPAQQFAIKSGYIKSLEKRVLLILDDVAAMDDDANLLKITGRNVDILITTREENLIDTQLVMLGSLGYEDGLLPLFQRNAQIPENAWDGWYHEHEEAVKEMIEQILLGHTMLVMLAARLLAVTDKSVEEIRDSLKNSRLSPEIKEKIRAFKDAGREDRGAADATLCEHVLNLFSIACLTGDEGKIDILRNMSLIPYSGVKRATLQAWLGLEDLNDVNALADSGWLTLSHVAGEKRVALHAVISDAVYIQTMPTAENCAVLLEAIANDLMVDAMKNPADKTYMIEYGEFALNRIKQEDLAVARIAHETGYLLHFRAEYKRALESYFKALNIKEKILGSRHPDTAATYNNIAGVYDSQGDYPKALEWYLKALEISEEVLGKVNQNTVTAYHNIAGVYDSMGDYARALEWYENSLKIRELVLGKEHPSTGPTYSGVALVYAHQGNYPMALEWYLKAIDIIEKGPSKEHPFTATAYNNIAGVYDSQGDYAKALEWYTKALTMRERVLGKEHPSTATSYHNIGFMYSRQGEYAKALEWYGKALTIREKVLNKWHPDMATSYSNIASVFARLGDYAKALQGFMRALTIFEEVLGKEHPNVASMYQNVAGVYFDQGNYTKALEWHVLALSIKTKVLDKEHPDIATSYNCIAGVFERLGDYEKALNLYFEALAINKKALGEEHPDTAATYNNIGNIYCLQGDYEEALEWHMKDMAISEKMLGDKHPETATTYYNIAGVYYRQENYAEALLWFNKALRIQETVLGKESPDIAATYKGIADVYDSQGNYTEALEWYYKALEIKEKILGKEHRSTAVTYNNIAYVYDNQGDSCKALEWYEKALSVFEKMPENEYLNIANTYNNIGTLYINQKNFAEALKWYMKILNINEEMLGKEHPSTAESYLNIGLLYACHVDYAEAIEWMNKALMVYEKNLGREHPSAVGIRQSMTEMKKLISSQ